MGALLNKSSNKEVIAAAPVDKTGEDTKPTTADTAEASGIHIRRFMCVCVCLPITREWNGRLPPNSQGSSGAPQGLF